MSHSRSPKYRTDCYVSKNVNGQFLEKESSQDTVIHLDLGLVLVQSQHPDIGLPNKLLIHHTLPEHPVDLTGQYRDLVGQDLIQGQHLGIIAP